MKNRGTVPNPLSPGEIFDLGNAAFDSIPRTLDALKVRADLSSKGTLRRDLKKFFYDRYATQSRLIDTASWTDFYRRVLGKEVDLSALLVPAKPDYPCWPIVIVPGVVSLNEAFDACRKQFGNAWRYYDDLNTVVDVVERPTTAYVVWVKALVEADPELASTSAEQIAERKIDTITLLERLVLELKYFDETKAHLDIENWTLCAGSRYAGGFVPCVRWSPVDRELGVNGYDVRSAGSGIRARAAVR